MSDTTRAPLAGVPIRRRRGAGEAGLEAGAAEAAGVLVGLDEFEVTAAAELDGVLEVRVRCWRGEAPCPRCGTFSGRVKQCRAQRVRDPYSFGRPVVLVWHKRRFRCGTPGCAASFTECAAQVPARKRLTGRLRSAVAAAALDRSTAAVARSFRVGWHTAWDAAPDAAGAKLAARPQSPPRRLGVDETTFKRPRRFMTGIAEPGNLQAVGHIRGPLQEGPRGPAAPPRRLRVRHRGGGDRPVRAVSGRGVRAAAG